MTLYFYNLNYLTLLALRFFVASFLVGSCLSCSQKIEIPPASSSQYKSKVSYFSSYSTQYMGKETPGTQFSYEYIEQKMQSQQQSFSIQYIPLGGKKMGYNKDLLPDRYLLYPLFYTIEHNFTAKLSHAQELNANLLRDTPSDLQKRWTERGSVENFRAMIQNKEVLRNALSPGQYIFPSLLSAEKLKILNAKLVGIKLDSLLIEGPEYINKQKCVQFQAYYTRQENPDIYIEQFMESFVRPLNEMQFSVASQYSLHPKYGRSVTQKYFQPHKFQGRWRFSNDRVSGLPCKETQTETASIVIESKSPKLSVPFDIYIYKEYIYKNINK